MKNKDNNNEEAVEPVDVCVKCGSKLATEDGKTFCPHCDGDIDFFGEDDDDEV